MLFMDLEASTINRIWSYVREEPSNKLARLGDTLVRNYDGLTQNWLVCLLSIFHQQFMIFFGRRGEVTP